MRLKATVVPCIAIAVSALLLGGCPKGGKGRRPGALTNPTGASDRAGAYPSSEPLDNGGDGVERLPYDGLRGVDIADDGTGGPLADVRFEYDSVALTPAAEQLLRAHAAWLRDNPATTAILEGHCDERGTVEYNLALGEQRSRVVNEFLVGLGLPASRFRAVSRGSPDLTDDLGGRQIAIETLGGGRAELAVQPATDLR
jgi:peptidoglycan-associated lipoprotein